MKLRQQTLKFVVICSKHFVVSADVHAIKMFCVHFILRRQDRLVFLACDFMQVHTLTFSKVAQAAGERTRDLLVFVVYLISVHTSEPYIYIYIFLKKVAGEQTQDLFGFHLFSQHSSAHSERFTSTYLHSYPKKII
jgi:hypothetical protein